MRPTLHVSIGGRTNSPHKRVGRRAGDETAHIGMEIGVFGEEFGIGRGRVPALDTPAAILANANDVEQGSPAHEIAMENPRIADRHDRTAHAEKRLRQFARNEAAIGDLSGEYGIAGIEQLAPGDRARAVGGDQ